MKNRKYILVLFLSMITLPLLAQNYDASFKQMKTAFNAGDFNQLSNLFSDSVDLTVRDTDGIFSKTQAKGVLKDFFAVNSPKSFVVKHQGSSNDGTVYAIGLYVSNKGSYRVYALLKNIAGNWKIVQLQIEDEI